MLEVSWEEIKKKFMRLKSFMGCSLAFMHAVMIKNIPGNFCFITSQQTPKSLKFFPHLNSSLIFCNHQVLLNKSKKSDQNSQQQSVNKFLAISAMRVH